MANRNYIEPADFYEEVVKCLKINEVSEKLATIFMMVSERFCNHSNWVRYRHIRDDLISEGTFACVRAFDKFSPYNKIGLLILNGLVKRDDDDRFSYNFKGESYDFKFSEIADVDIIDGDTHSGRINMMFDALKDSGSMLSWDGEDVEYDYKICYNPHAFFTMVMSNALKQFLKKEYNQKNIFNKMCVMNNIDPDFGYIDMMKEAETDE